MKKALSLIIVLLMAAAGFALAENEATWEFDTSISPWTATAARAAT